MHQYVAIFIGLRYVCGRAADRFSRFVSWLSTIGIIVGVLAMVTVLSVMNGFERELEENILGLMPQALITSPLGSINPKQQPAASIKLKGINRIALLTTANVVLQSPHNIALGVMLGIQPDDTDPLTPYLVNTQQKVLQPGQYNVILGKQLALQLRVRDGEKLRLMVPSVSQFTPMGRMLSQRLFTVAGTYAANSEVEGYQILVNQQDASHILHYPEGNATGWRLWLDKPLDVAAISQQVLPSGLVWKDWRERKGDLFQAARMEKNMMGLLLSLIIVVAVFNIITSLGLLIMEKQGEVAILQTQGLTRRQILLVFIVQGASAGIIGTLLGVLLGVLLASQLNNLLSVASLFFDRVTLPVDINLWQIVTISLSIVVIALLSTLYPAWRAAAVQPAEALRYE